MFKRQIICSGLNKFQAAGIKKTFQRISRIRHVGMQVAYRKEEILLLNKKTQI